ncbi:VOC family protein [Miniimonas arenae]|uniref:VOC family protein n=1 Tax=Miniimonas arenae TaxID=676201 RepID=UPI0035E4032A
MTDGRPARSRPPRLGHADVTASVDERHWRVLLRTLRATFTSDSYLLLVEFAGAVTELAQELHHHPELHLRWGRVTVTTTSHDARGLTERDVELAERVSVIAEEMGLVPTAPRMSVQEVAIDALDIAAVWPFWAAVLGYDAHVEEHDGELDVELVDPDGLGPAYWFQQMDAPRPQRNRIHLDVTVGHDEAEPRIAAALEAGGRLVSDAAAPAFWVLADPEGNEACVCTWQGRPTA